MVDIRPATPKDLPQLAELVRQQFEYQQQFDPLLQLNPLTDWIEYVSARLRRKDTQIFVAEQERNLVGYHQVRVAQQEQNSTTGRAQAIVRRLAHPLRKKPVSIIHQRRLGYSEDVYLKPSVRNQGVGTQLSLRNFQWLEAQGVHEIEASILVGNEVSQDFFRKLGFEVFRVQIRMTQALAH